MTVIHAAARQRLTAENRPNGCPASSAGMFVIRADGTARFDRHYHDIGEFWFIASGKGTVPERPWTAKTKWEACSAAVSPVSSTTR
ncbi:hypothetical protein [Streptosporangium sp. NPDC000396]|uniref:hypothetical protein n=1 Tax=Streptosporangium sp. NPDC000396 TaxID=3366185 RepID=UPI0036B377CD